MSYRCFCDKTIAQSQIFSLLFRIYLLLIFLTTLKIYQLQILLWFSLI